MGTRSPKSFLSKMLLQNTQPTANPLGVGQGQRVRTGDSLEDIRWMHGLRGERFVARGVLRSSLPNLKKKAYRLCQSRRIEKNCPLFCAHQRSIVFF